MNLKVDEWKIIEEGFDPGSNRSSESIFSLGNGHMGQRANFEEDYSGDTLQGNYIAGIYYPDKTRVGWWKNGYPEYFAKVLNAPSWIDLSVNVNGELLDIARCRVKSFSRTLNMKEGTLTREAEVEMNNGTELAISSLRFISMDDHETAALSYTVKVLKGEGIMEIVSAVNGDVVNEDSNYGEQFWEEVSRGITNGVSFIVTSTRKTNFSLATAMHNRFLLNGNNSNDEQAVNNNSMLVSRSYVTNFSTGDELKLEKLVSVMSSLNHDPGKLEQLVSSKTLALAQEGFDKLLDSHKRAWLHRWNESDVEIKGDARAQQGIRFSIFQLLQTYTGDDPRLNIGPKGFTGEKYGGSTYWDTEAFALPFYLNTSAPEVARNLLLYRYNHLEKAIENAKKLGFKNGAALYPMVTMNGEECHNEWEITFEEIHRNGAIAYAIRRYINHTGDEDYLSDYGIEVLIAISRFWSQRVNFSSIKKSYVILGVTGPNEYENNVNNNWYTNRMAAWTLAYTIESLGKIQSSSEGKYSEVIEKTGLEEKEIKRWHEIIENMYYPVSEEHGIFLQQDNYLDKEQILADDLDPSERPLNQHWSWDRILRSCFIKQADVMQGIYNFEDEYDKETIRRNFDFYEPRTVHESSLSPGIYSIMASHIGYTDKAYELYLRTARLDLDDYNKEVKEGLHITSMAGTWLSIVEGFGGMRIRDKHLHLSPLIPRQWESYSFMMRFMNQLLKVNVSGNTVSIFNISDRPLPIVISGQKHIVKAGTTEIFLI